MIDQSHEQECTEPREVAPGGIAIKAHRFIMLLQLTGQRRDREGPINTVAVHRAREARSIGNVVGRIDGSSHET